MTRSERRSAPAAPMTAGGAAFVGAYSWVLVAATLVLALDQTSKRIVVNTLADGRVIDLFGGLIRLDSTYNTGAAFGLFKNAGLVFVLIALVVTGAFVFYRHRIAVMPLAVRLELGLVLGGAIGNALDRVRLGYVVDFIDLRWWPVFNLADSAIVLGAALLTLHSLRTSGGRHEG